MTRATSRPAREVAAFVMRAFVCSILVFVAGGCGGTEPAPAVSIVSVAPGSLTLGVGGSERFTATARDASLNPLDVPISWRSSNTSVATVTSDGLVSAKAAGNASIVATAGGVSGEAALVVTSGPSRSAVVGMPGFTFTPAQVRIAVGGTVTFQFPALPHNVIFDRSVAGAPADIQQTANRNVDRVFTTEGTFAYDCTLHPGMSAVVQVSR